MTLSLGQGRWAIKGGSRPTQSIEMSVTVVEIVKRRRSLILCRGFGYSMQVDPLDRCLYSLYGYPHHAHVLSSRNHKIPTLVELMTLVESSLQTV